MEQTSTPAVIPVRQNTLFNKLGRDEMNPLKKNALRFMLYFLFFVFSVQLAFSQNFAQTKNEIYRNAYKTALADGTVSADERAILNALRISLNLSKQDIAKIRAQFQINSGYIDQSGRWLLVAQNMIYGASVYGWMIPDVLGAKDSKWYIGSEMISLAGSFYFTYRLTRNMQLSLARANMLRLGSLIGLRYGFGIGTIFNLDKGNRKAWELAVMATIPIGAWIGEQLNKHWQPSHGQSWTLNLGAGIGGFTLMQLHRIFDEPPAEPVMPGNIISWEVWENSNTYKTWEKQYDEWQRWNTVIELAGYPVGVYLTHHFWGNKSHSVGDALMLTQGALAGSFYGLALARILNADFDNSKWQLFPVTGLSLGAILMDRYIDGYDYSLGQGFVSVLGTVSGMAFLAGLGVITDIHDGGIMAALTMGGGLAGTYLTNKIFNLKKEGADTAPGKKVSLMLAPSLQLSKKQDHVIAGLNMVAVF